MKAQSHESQRKLRRSIVYLLFALLAFLLLLNLAPRPVLHLPERTWQLRRAETIIVLGTPTTKSGQASPTMRERVKAAVELFRRGLADKIIMTGAAAHNKFIEADVMAAEAISMGVPSDNILREGEAKNTYQNAFNSYSLMNKEGMHSAIVVSSPAHLLRANLIFSRYPIDYCMFASDYPPEQNWWDRLVFDQREKYFVLADVILNKGILLGLKPDQARQMPAIADEAEQMHKNLK